MRAVTARLLGVVGLGLATASVSFGAGCHANVPMGQHEERCHTACREKAAARCNDAECVRGCRFALDRLLEREGGNVVACVAAAKGPCDDQAWADCSARTGADHADGGPPAPLPPVEEE